jgi:NIPSNAP
MIYEERNYTIHIGRMQDLLDLHESIGLPIQRRHLGEPVAYFTSETGRLNQLVHIWAYRDLEDRATRRAALYADSEWVEYLPRVLPFIKDMENRILKPTRFSNLR